MPRLVEPGPLVCCCYRETNTIDAGLQAVVKRLPYELTSGKKRCFLTVRSSEFLYPLWVKVELPDVRIRAAMRD